MTEPAARAPASAAPASPQLTSRAEAQVLREADPVKHIPPTLSHVDSMAPIETAATTKSPKNSLAPSSTTDHPANATEELSMQASSHAPTRIEPEIAPADALDFGPEPEPAALAAPQPAVSPVAARKIEPHPQAPFVGAPLSSTQFSLGAEIRLARETLVEPEERRQSGTAIASAPERDVTDDEFVVYIPCRVCETLFKPTDVYAEPNGQAICKTCWGEVGSTAAARMPLAAAAMSVAQGVTLAAPPVVGPPAGAVFCEKCNIVFPPDRLTLTPDGLVLCRNCVRNKRLKDKEIARNAERIAELANAKISKKRGGLTPQQRRGQLIKIVLSMNAIAFVMWRLYVAGVLFPPDHKVKPSVHTDAKVSSPGKK